MRLLKTLLRIALILVILLVAVAFVLPREIEVVRTTSINAPAEAVFPYVNSMQQTEAWSPWLDRDPDVQLSYSGPESGVGNRMEWASDHPQVGNGSQEITQSVENERVVTALDFGDMGTAEAQFVLEDTGKTTGVTWGFVTDAGMNPIMRYMGLMMDRWVGADYEKGLANLKAVVEG